MRLFLLALCFGVVAPVHAELKVLASVPEWASLVAELGGDKVSVTAATTAMQDPHHVEARPSLIARARTADLLVVTGADLEIGWVPLVVAQSGNARIRPGRPGHFEAAAYVTTLEKPARVDRAEGDVHPQGNPHVHLDPRNILRIAAQLAQRMGELDPPNASHYAARLAAFSERWRAAVAKWESSAADLRGVPVAVQHTSFSYLISWLGLVQVATLEPKPGVEPSAAYLSQVLDALQRQPVRMVLRAAYQSDRASSWIAERGKLNAVVLPFTVGGTAGATDLYSLFDDTIARLHKGAR